MYAVESDLFYCMQHYVFLGYVGRIVFQHPILLWQSESVCHAIFCASPEYSSLVLKRIPSNIMEPRSVCDFEDNSFAQERGIAKTGIH